jgi:hypothetical protein
VRSGWAGLWKGFSTRLGESRLACYLPIFDGRVKSLIMLILGRSKLFFYS